MFSQSSRRVSAEEQMMEYIGVNVEYEDTIRATMTQGLPRPAPRKDAAI